MKPEALEKAAATARELARRLEEKARKAGEATRAAKDKARKSKAKLKLAKREAKELRQAAKAAKRGFAEALQAAEKASDLAAALEKKIQKRRKPSAPGHANGKHVAARKRVAGKLPGAGAKAAPRDGSGGGPVHVPAPEPKREIALRGPAHPSAAGLKSA